VKGEEAFLHLKAESSFLTVGKWHVEQVLPFEVRFNLRSWFRDICTAEAQRDLLEIRVLLQQVIEIQNTCLILIILGTQKMFPT